MPGTDKTALQEALNIGKAIKVDGYTEESYAELTKALEEGQKVLDNADASQEDADNAAQAIRTAISGLKQAVPSGGYTVIYKESPISNAKISVSVVGK